MQSLDGSDYQWHSMETKGYPVDKKGEDGRIDSVPLTVAAKKTLENIGFLRERLCVIDQDVDDAIKEQEDGQKMILSPNEIALIAFYRDLPEHKRQHFIGLIPRMKFKMPLP